MCRQPALTYVNIAVSGCFNQEGSVANMAVPCVCVCVCVCVGDTCQMHFYDVCSWVREGKEGHRDSV